jgi:hypothetical protein
MLMGMLGFAYMTANFGLYLNEDMGFAPYELATQIANRPETAMNILTMNPVSDGLVQLYGAATGDPKAKPLDEIMARQLIPVQVRRLMAVTGRQYIPNQGTIAHRGQDQYFISGQGFNTGVEATKWRRAFRMLGARDAAMQETQQRLRDRNKELSRFRIEKNRLMREAARKFGEGDFDGYLESMREAWPYYYSTRNMHRAFMLTRASMVADPMTRQIEKEPRVFRAQAEPLDLEVN